MIYLASPYSHADENVRRRRFDAACRAAAHLMEQGEIVFSPIAHAHHIEGAMSAPRDTGWWLWQNGPLMKACNRLVILKLAGWDISAGIAVEREVFALRGIEPEFMETA